MHMRTLPALGGALLTLTLLSACGHTPATTAAASTSSKQADALKYAQCMRSHGVDIPDPQTTGSGGGFAIRIQGGPGSGINPDSTTFQNAQKACQSLLPNGGQLTPQQQAQAQQNALDFARCMRAHGVDIPDPQPGSNGAGIRIGGPGSAKINPDDPNFQSAQQACGSKLGKAGTFSVGSAKAGGGGSGSGGGMAVAGG